MSDQRDVLAAFRGVRKTYDGETLVVRDLDLDIRRGEFLTLLGPSGSGKTTTLMMLAGFETPTAGEITARGPPPSRAAAAQARHRHGVPELRAVPAHDGRRERRLPAVGARPGARRDRAARRARARHGAARRLRRAPARRSFRAASSSASPLARALVFEPKLVLMDEPLGALDKQLREQMQLEIRHLHERLGVTDGLRDARPGRGADDVRPHRRVPPRADPAARHARRSSTSSRATPSSRASSARTTASTARWSRSAAADCTVRIAERRMRSTRALADVGAAGGAASSVSLRPERVRSRAGHTIRRRGVSTARRDAARSDLSGRSRPGALIALAGGDVHGEAPIEQAACWPRCGESTRLSGAGRARFHAEGDAAPSPAVQRAED